MEARRCVCVQDSVGPSEKSLMKTSPPEVSEGATSRYNFGSAVPFARKEKRARKEKLDRTRWFGMLQVNSSGARKNASGFFRRPADVVLQIVEI
jgi:hypothetical protein